VGEELDERPSRLRCVVEQRPKLVLCERLRVLLLVVAVDLMRDPHSGGRVRPDDTFLEGGREQGAERCERVAGALELEDSGGSRLLEGL